MGGPLLAGLARFSRLSRMTTVMSLYRSQGKQVRQFSQSLALRSGHGPYFYRQYPLAARKWVIMAEGMGAFFWWWVFWHCMTDYGHIIGEFPFPNVKDWTDEELGIPPDTEEVE